MSIIDEFHMRTMDALSEKRSRTRVDGYVIYFLKETDYKSIFRKVAEKLYPDKEITIKVLGEGKREHNKHRLTGRDQAFLWAGRLFNKQGRADYAHPGTCSRVGTIQY